MRKYRLFRRWLSLFFVVSSFIGCAGFTDGAAAGRTGADGGGTGTALISLSASSSAVISSGTSVSGSDPALQPESGSESAVVTMTGSGTDTGASTGAVSGDIPASVSVSMSGASGARDASMLRNGGSFVYVVREDGSIAGWGDNRMGQLGTAPAKLFLKPQSVAEGIDGEELADLQCGNENTLFLKKDGTVWTCGTYARGTQGLGRLNHIVSRPVRIPGLERIVEISCGFGHNAALDEDGHVWIWGRNDYGQLGLGDRTARNEPVMMPLENIVHVNCGGKFTLAQDRDGILWGWGSNTHQVLAAGKKTQYTKPRKLEGFDGKRIVAFSGGSDCAFWLDEDGVIWSRGRNEYRQLGSEDAGRQDSSKLMTVDIPEKVRTVCAYSAATAALTEGGNVYIWGSVSAGQLGTGKSPNSTFPVLVYGEGDAVEVAMGSLISSFRTADGRVMVAGYNKYGQLGDGTTRSTNHWTWNGTTTGPVQP